MSFETERKSVIIYESPHALETDVLGTLKDSVL